MAGKPIIISSKHLDFKTIDLGKGKRSVVKNGVFIDKFGITVPKELEEHGKDI